MKLLTQAAIILVVVTLTGGGHPAIVWAVLPRSAAEIRMSTKPLLSILRTEDLDAYDFAGINGGARLADGSEVVLDWSHSQMQKPPLESERLWSRGRNGEWRGEFDFLYLTPRFVTSAQRTGVYDIWT